MTQTGRSDTGTQPSELIFHLSSDSSALVSGWARSETQSQGKEIAPFSGCSFVPELYSDWISSVQFSSSVVSNSVIPWTASLQVSLCITNSWSLLKLMSIESVILSNHLILCLPLLLPPSIFPSIRVFSSESVLHIRWPKCWSFSFSISACNEYLGLIFFRIDWFDLLAVQGTLKSLL